VVLTQLLQQLRPYHFPEKLVPVIILKALAGKPLPIYGDGSNVAVIGLCRGSRRRSADRSARGQQAAPTTIGGEKTKRTKPATGRRPCCGIPEICRPKDTPYADQITYVTDRPGLIPRLPFDPHPHPAEELGWRPRHRRGRAESGTVNGNLDNETMVVPRLQERAGRRQRNWEPRQLKYWYSAKRGQVAQRALQGPRRCGSDTGVSGP